MVLVLLAFAAAPTLATHRNCSDFDTHAQAQRYFENANHETSDLDADGGDACESLPGYSAGGSNGGGNGGGNGGVKTSARCPIRPGSGVIRSAPYLCS